MGPETFITALRLFSKQALFRTFLIELTSGEQIRVSHPEAVDLRGDLIVFRDPQGRYSLFDASSVVRLCHVPMETGPASQENQS